MPQPITRGTPCPCCGIDQWARLLQARDFHYGNQGEFQVLRCIGCSVWALHPMPPADELASYYPETYYSFQTGRTPSRLQRLLTRVLGLKRRTLLPDKNRPGRLLDVGCGSGTYIGELAQLGWRVAGIEPSASAAAAGRDHGLDITSGSIHDLQYPAGSFDVVRFNHSFEHIADPEQVLAAASRLLKPNGALFIGVPNTRGLWARVFGQFWWYLGLPVHTYGYDPSNLTRMTERAGFMTERIRYYSEYAGLLGSLQIWANRNREPPSSTGPLFASRLLRLPALWLCRALDLVHMGDCIEYVGRKHVEYRR